MNKYDFSGNLLDLKGKELLDNGSPLNLSDLLGNSLLGKTPGLDALKAVGFAVQLANNGGILQVDDADKKKLQEVINSSETFGNLVKNALLTVFDNPVAQ